VPGGSIVTGAAHLRLVWPQWQGAGTESILSLAPERRVVAHINSVADVVALTIAEFVPR
jgi:hypothetical protein